MQEEAQEDLEKATGTGVGMYGACQVFWSWKARGKQRSRQREKGGGKEKGTQQGKGRTMKDIGVSMLQKPHRLMQVGRIFGRGQFERGCPLPLPDFACNPTQTSRRSEKVSEETQCCSGSAPANVQAKQANGSGFHLQQWRNSSFQ